MGRPRLSERDLLLLGTGARIPASQPHGRRRPPSPPKTAVGTGGPDTTRVLGLDLASTTGWCLLVAGQPVAHGRFTVPERANNETLAHWHGRQAARLGEQVRLLISTHRPELLAYEYPDGYRRSWSGGTKGREFVVAAALGRLQGFLVALWPSIGDDVRLVAVSTTDAKRIATGRVDASKDQVAYALRTYRRWDLSGWTADETDAAAIALAAREAGI